MMRGKRSAIPALFAVFCLVFTGFLWDVSFADETTEGDTTSPTSPSLAVGDSDVIVNGSFETPVVTGAFYRNFTSVDGWSTTASDSKFEVVTTATSTVPDHLKYGNAAAAEGTKFSELERDRRTTQHQILDTQAGVEYNWRVSHRARYKADNNGSDIMVVLIGDYLGNDPTKLNFGRYTTDQFALSGSLDPFMKMTVWLKNNVDQSKRPLVSSEVQADGIWEPVTFYTSGLIDGETFRYQNDGGSSNPYSGAIQFTKDEKHSYQWTAYFVCDDADAWNTYERTYTATSDKTIFAMTNYYTHMGTSGRGNLIDNASFSAPTGEELLVNGGYESCVRDSQASEYYSSRAANHGGGKDRAETGWRITDSSGMVEFDEITGYKTTAKESTLAGFTDPIINYDVGKVSVPDGNQFVELDANEVSTLYQNVTTVPNSKYEWGLYHRGRVGVDAMAVVIGPQQAATPQKNSAGSDQYYQIVDWVTNQKDIDFGIDVVNYSQTGISKKITVYSTPFAASGEFEAASDGGSVYGWTAEGGRTEKWELWVVVSDNIDWTAYGNVTEDALGDDCSYIAPEGQTGTTFAFVSVAAASGSLTVGNLLDDVTLSVSYPVRVSTSSGGTGLYTSGLTTDTATVTSDAAKFEYLPAGSGFSVTAVPSMMVDGTTERTFLGAYINGVFVPVDGTDADGNGWTLDETTGHYTYTIADIGQPYEIALVYSAQHAVYDANGGDVYHVIEGDETSGPEVDLSSTNDTYTSRPATSSNADWHFEGWLYAQGNQLFDGEHTLTYDADADTIAIADNSGHSATASASDGVTMVAQWTYRQSFTTQVYDLASDSYTDSTAGGTVAVTPSTQAWTGDSGPYSQADGATSSVWVDDLTVMNVVAQPANGFTFVGWYDAETGELITSSQSYEYQVADRSSQHLVARFDPLGHALAFSKTVTGYGGDTSRYFRVVVSVSGARANANYIVEGTAAGDITLENTTVTNPTVLTADANGNASATFYVTNGNNVHILNLPAGSVYSVEEGDYSSLGYTTTGNAANQALAADTQVAIVNAREGMSLTLHKVSLTAEDMGLSGAEFSLTNADGQTFTLTSADDGYTTSDFLSAGTYTVSETVAPSGYTLINVPVTLSVTDGSITLTSAQDKHWQLDQAEDGSITLTAKDESMEFSLPATGGSGTVVIISLGIGLMLTAAWGLRRELK